MAGWLNAHFSEDSEREILAALMLIAHHRPLRAGTGSDLMDRNINAVASTFAKAFGLTAEVMLWVIEAAKRDPSCSLQTARLLKHKKGDHYNVALNALVTKADKKDAWAMLNFLSADECSYPGEGDDDSSDGSAESGRDDDDDDNSSISSRSSKASDLGAMLAAGEDESMMGVVHKVEEYESVFNKYVDALNEVQTMLESEDRKALESDEDSSANFCKGLVRSIMCTASCRTPETSKSISLNIVADLQAGQNVAWSDHARESNAVLPDQVASYARPHNECRAPNSDVFESCRPLLCITVFANGPVFGPALAGSSKTELLWNSMMYLQEYTCHETDMTSIVILLVNDGERELNWRVRNVSTAAAGDQTNMNELKFQIPSSDKSGSEVGSDVESADEDDEEGNDAAHKSFEYANERTGTLAQGMLEHVVLQVPPPQGENSASTNADGEVLIAVPPDGGEAVFCFENLQVNSDGEKIEPDVYISVKVALETSNRFNSDADELDEPAQNCKVVIKRLRPADSEELMKKMKGAMRGTETLTASTVNMLPLLGIDTSNTSADQIMAEVRNMPITFMEVSRLALDPGDLFTSVPTHMPST
jgi:hypothetical protein